MPPGESGAPGGDGWVLATTRVARGEHEGERGGRGVQGGRVARPGHLVVRLAGQLEREEVRRPVCAGGAPFGQLGDVGMLEVVRALFHFVLVEHVAVGDGASRSLGLD